MGFEDVDEQMEWECRRIAAAFDVEVWRVHESPNVCICGGQNIAGTSIGWDFSRQTGALNRISIGGIPYGTQIHTVQGKWQILLRSRLTEIMVRGLYCLGLEDETVFEQLGGLTAQEKLELRLSMPREFWPQKWLDEEAKEQDLES